MSIETLKLRKSSQNEAASLHVFEYNVSKGRLRFKSPVLFGSVAVAGERSQGTEPW